MVSGTRMFLAGVGTTFTLLTVGFGGGLMLAKTALHDNPPAQTRASLGAVRVILPKSAEAAQPPEPGKAVPTEPEPQVQQALAVQPVEKLAPKVDTKKAEREERERHRWYAERKAKQIARARHQLEQPQQRPEPSIMAFGEQPRTVGFFGN